MHINSARLPARVALFLPPIAAAYAILAMVTPLSADFIDNLVGPIEMPSESLLQTAWYAPWRLSIKGFYEFLSFLGLAPVQRPSEVIGFWYWQAGPGGYLLLLALKLPILIFTLVSGIMIYLLGRRLGGGTDRAFTTMLLWFANPLVVISTVMWGTWDVVALFFTLVSLMLVLRGKTVLSGICLFVGFALKVMPTILLPVYLIYLYRTSMRGFLRFTVTFAGPLALGGLVALWLGGQPLAANAERIFTFYFSGFAGVTFEAGLFELSSTIVALSLLILFAARSWRFREGNLLELVLAYVLVFFAIAFWNAQYLVYPMAFLAIFYATARNRITYLTTVLTAIGTSIIVFGFYFSSWGHSVLFIPNYTTTMQELSFFILMLPGHPIGHPLGVILRSIFAATCFYLAVMIFIRNAGNTHPLSSDHVTG